MDIKELGRNFVKIYFNMLEKSALYALAANFLFMLPAYQNLITSRRDPKRNGILQGKPFTCLYCLTFWGALIASLFIPLIIGASPEPLVVVAAPVLAEAFNRWFKSLPVSL